MKYFRLIVIALFLCSISVFSQDNSIKHTIVKGETISSIAQKYNVSIASIYKLNPKAKKTLQLNQVLLIPNSESKKTNDLTATDSEKATEINHQVLPQETLYGITKQFKTTTELLYKANPQLEAEGLKVGQTIIIPSSLTKKEIASLSNSKTQEVVEAVEQTTPLAHQVKAKESLYVIAKMYGVSLKELQSANPKIGKKGLSIGQIIAIPNNGKIVEKEIVVEEKKPEIKDVPVAVLESKETVAVENATKENVVKTDSQIQTTEIFHKVLTKETKYGIAKKYGITVADLEKQNPAIQQKLLVGSKLSIQVLSEKVEKNSKEEVVESHVEKPKDTINASVNIPNADLIDQIIQLASDKIGTRYRSGGTTTAGFDCSGFMYSTFGAFDIKLPRSSIEQSSVGEKINDENAQKGDLIFFKTNGRHHINHVGMVIEVAEDEIKFIHSSTHSGVIISSTKEPYYQRNFAQVNRVIK
ncbi:C40 family peptidase [Flavobacterium sp.]|uniref:C40 family peptidase n=1 Tax=Flavobacterium sp. TaxID=239 RepID=UPI002DBD012E|nr:LysM peptidoglycan-binding domain-containing protein [Flavobacterium sp.]